MLLAGAFAIAIAPIFVRVSEFGPIATAFYRLAFAWPPLWAWARVTTPGPGVTSRPGLRDALALTLPGLFFAFDLATWHWSIRLTTVANATLLANLAPVFVVLGSWWLFRERFTRRFLVGVALAIVGLLLLSGASLGRPGQYFLGDMLGVATAVFYAAYLISVSRLRRRYPTSVIMHWSSLAGAVVLLPLALVANESLVNATALGWITVLALAWFSHAGGQSLIAFALAHLPAAYSSVVLIAQPLFAGLFAWLLFNESLTRLQWAGATIILLGIGLASQRRSRRPADTDLATHHSPAPPRS